MNILKDSEIFTAEQIKTIEDKKYAIFVCDTCLMNIHGNWVNSPVAVFWNKYPSKIPKTGSAWFGLFFNPDGVLMVVNAISAVETPIDGVVADNGDVIYSRYRHDFRSSPDDSVFVDGGRDYLRCSSVDPTRTVKLQIVRGELQIVAKD